MLFSFGCVKHRVNLEGQPTLVVKQDNGRVRFWEASMEHMVCPVDEAEDSTEGTRCRQSWRVGEA